MLKLNPVRNLKFYKNAFAQTVQYKPVQEIQRDCFVKNSPSFDENKYVFGKIVKSPVIYNFKTKTNEDCLLFSAQEENKGCVRLVKNDMAKIEFISEFFKREKPLYEEFKNYACTSSEAFLDKVKGKSKKAADYMKEIFISEIGYAPMRHIRELDMLEKFHYNQINDEKDIICVQNFIVNKKEYENASKYPLSYLFKVILKDNPNVIIRAEAFGENPKSPINMYLRWGFLPLDKTLGDLKAAKGQKLAPNISSVMYLPENAKFYNIIYNNRF